VVGATSIQTPIIEPKASVICAMVAAVVVRDEAACKEMDGTFYAKDDGGIDACVQACSAE
jgi:hypothetical protein